MNEPTNGADGQDDGVFVDEMRRRRDRYVAFRLIGQVFSELGDALGLCAVLAGAWWLGRDGGWPTPVTAAVAAGFVVALAALPRLQDWLGWRRDRAQPLSEAELDQLAVTVIEGEEDQGARSMPWRRGTT